MMTQLMRGSTELKARLIEFYNDDIKWIKSKMEKKYPAFKQLDIHRQNAIINFCYTVGWKNFGKYEDEIDFSS